MEAFEEFKEREWWAQLHWLKRASRLLRKDRLEKTKRQDGNHVEKTYGSFADTKGQGSHDSNVCKISRIGESMETEGRAMVAMGWEKKVDG